MSNRPIKCLTFLIISLTMACASTPQTSNYYLIESPATDSVINSAHKIVLHPIELSDYLKSSNLHVKDSSGQVIYSATDLWAEQPSKVLWRAIELSLENQTGHHVLASHETPDSCAQIKIRINQLSPTSAGKVVSAGRWFISNQGSTLETREFSFAGHIDTDGYAASNQVIAGQLHQLASELEEQIEYLGLCQNSAR